MNHELSRKKCETGSAKKHEQHTFNYFCAALLVKTSSFDQPKRWLARDF
jgi:hypothetical protein